jgi:hypothetical protein
MAKDETASRRSAEVARANAHYTINLQRAFRDLLLKLERACGQPTETIARRRHRWWNYYLKTMTFREMVDAGIIVPSGQTRNGEPVYIPNSALPESELQRAVERGAVGEYVDALLAVAHFLDQMGPYPAYFGNEFATLAQVLRDLQKGIRTPMLDPAPVKSRRRDPTMVSLGRAYVALAVAALQKCGYSRESAAEWAAKKYPGLKKLITEKGSYRSIKNSTDRKADRDIGRSLNLETTIVTWCKDFSRNKPLKDDETADRVYRAALDELKARKDRLEEYADWLLQQALQIDC